MYKLIFILWKAIDNNFRVPLPGSEELDEDGKPNFRPALKVMKVELDPTNKRQLTKTI